ncbi:MAG: hypothetical protein QNI87_06495 [Erythrobacter sp.]|uniref:hypothetical protein n=1 Tax=Erythrobacter sp. TaxID=1042 RepID=UPI00260AF23A|nr:hypothetical protein [Erythrobacter sp.]MDJ0978166.1 hypothetical protein [Erythrobacter sp.]
MAEDKTKRGVTRRRAMWYGTGGVALAGSAAMLAYLGLRSAGGKIVEAEVFPAGYGRDPQLVNPVRPAWQLSLSEDQRSQLSAIADIVLVPDAEHPRPSEVGVPAFLEEWLSAPYPDQKADRDLILPLLERLSARSETALASELPRLAASGDEAMLRLIELVAGGYVSTRAGQRAIGFIGDQASLTFEGPPPAVVAEIERRAAAL